jgi:hypothetical protein
MRIDVMYDNIVDGMIMIMVCNISWGAWDNLYGGRGMVDGIMNRMKLGVFSGDAVNEVICVVLR